MGSSGNGDSFPAAYASYNTPNSRTNTPTAHNVVHGQQQYVFFFSQSQQLPPQQRPAPQVKAGLRFLGCHDTNFGLTLRLRELAQITNFQWKSPRGMYDLHWTLTQKTERRTQGFVPTHYFVQSSLEGGNIQNT